MIICLFNVLQGETSSFTPIIRIALYSYTLRQLLMTEPVLRVPQERFERSELNMIILLEFAFHSNLLMPTDYSHHREKVLRLFRHFLVK